MRAMTEVSALQEYQMRCSNSTRDVEVAYRIGERTEGRSIYRRPDILHLEARVVSFSKVEVIVHVLIDEQCQQFL